MQINDGAFQLTGVPTQKVQPPQRRCVWGFISYRSGLRSVLTHIKDFVELAQYASSYTNDEER